MSENNIPKDVMPSLDMPSFAMIGALGRMGRAIIETAEKNKSARLVAAVEYDKHPLLNTDVSSALGIEDRELLLSSLNSSVGKEALVQADGVIDFSSPVSTLQMLEVAQELNKPAVIGTTGWNDEQHKKVFAYAETIPVVFSSNMSVGVNTLFALTRMAARILTSKGYEPEIMEIHHNQKKDAPSGTARTLEEIVLQESEIKKENCVYGREGMVGARPKNELGVMSLRGGDVTGEHTVYFFGEGERVELKHLATSREIFAKGALLALDYVRKQKAGLYSMADVIGLNF